MTAGLLLGIMLLLFKLLGTTCVEGQSLITSCPGLFAMLGKHMHG
jgi:hypothetical protein